MPEISRFYGIVIRMFINDHAPPHFHARHGSENARVAIATGEVLGGSLPRPAMRRIRKWSNLHRPELEANWRRLRAHVPPRRIEPLR